MKPGSGARTQAEPTHQRHAERHDVEVSVDLDSDSNFYTGLTHNISADRKSVV